MNDVISLRVALILTEMGLKRPISFQMEDCAVIDCGPPRMYQFRLEVRDDVDTVDFILDLCAIMTAHNRISAVHANLCGFYEEPGPVKNWHTAYLTVKVL